MNTLQLRMESQRNRCGVYATDVVKKKKSATYGRKQDWVTLYNTHSDIRMNIFNAYIPNIFNRFIHQ